MRFVLTGKSSTAVGRSLASAAHLHICSGCGACLLQCYDYASGRCKGKQAAVKRRTLVRRSYRLLLITCCVYLLPRYTNGNSGRRKFSKTMMQETVPIRTLAGCCSYSCGLNWSSLFVPLTQERTNSKAKAVFCDTFVFFSRNINVCFVTRKEICLFVLGLINSYEIAGPKKVLPMHQVSFIREHYKGIGKDSMTLSWLVSYAFTFATAISFLYTTKFCILAAVEKKWYFIFFKTMCNTNFFPQKKTIWRCLSWKLV